MKDIQNGISRRSFIKSAGAAGLGSALAPLVGRGTAQAATPAHAAEITGVPTRPFGRSGIHVPILSLGGMFDIPSNQTMLKQAIRWGVTYWDTAHSLQRRTQRGRHRPVLQELPRPPREDFPGHQIHIPEASRGMSKDLATSLERMNTDHIDLFFVHGIRDADTMDSGMRDWAREQKAEGKIRLFGFSTHSNMEQCLLDAARLDWIDGIMMTYNFRLMHEEKMKAAVKACVDAGIGLTAMKTQGGGAVGTATSRELELAGRFVQKGFTDKQAKLKAVWENSADFGHLLPDAHHVDPHGQHRRSRGSHDADRQRPAAPGAVCPGDILALLCRLHADLPERHRGKCSRGRRHALSHVCPQLRGFERCPASLRRHSRCCPQKDDPGRLLGCRGPMPQTTAHCPTDGRSP